MEHGNRRIFSIGMIVTAILGLIFLFGVMIFEWGLFPILYKAHLTPWENKYGAVVFAMTGMHALHVVSWHYLHSNRLEPGAQGQLLAGAPLGR